MIKKIMNNIMPFLIHRQKSNETVRLCNAADLTTEDPFSEDETEYDATNLE